MNLRHTGFCFVGAYLLVVCLIGWVMSTIRADVYSVSVDRGKALSTRKLYQAELPPDQILTFKNADLCVSYLFSVFRIGFLLAFSDDDVTVVVGKLLISIPAKKHVQRGGAIDLPLNLYGVDFIQQLWEKTNPGKKLWSFSTPT